MYQVNNNVITYIGNYYQNNDFYNHQNHSSYYRHHCNYCYYHYGNRKLVGLTRNAAVWWDDEPAHQRRPYKFR
jgi:hypothetical protein